MKRLASHRAGRSEAGSGRRAAARRCVPGQAWVGALTAFRAPAYCLSAPPPSRASRCLKWRAALTSAHSETPRQPSRASPRSRCSQRGAIPLPARHRDHVRYARNEQRVRDKHQSASMHHLHVKRAFDPRSDCAGKAALHVPSAAVRAAHAAYTLHGCPATTRTPQRPRPSELAGGSARKVTFVQSPSHFLIYLNDPLACVSAP